MKKILGISLVAMMAVTTAHANIASEAWVNSKTGDLTNLSQGLSQDNLVAAINSVATTAGNALTSSSALNGANITAGTVPETALDSTTQGKIDGALQSSTASTTYATKAEVGDTGGLETTYGNGNDTVVKALAAVATTAGNALTSSSALNGANITAGTVPETALDSATQTKIDGAVQSVALASGEDNGTVTLTVDGQETVVEVPGLGSAAYTDSTDYIPVSSNSTGSTGTQVLTRVSNGQGGYTYMWETITRPNQ